MSKKRPEPTALAAGTSATATTMATESKSPAGRPRGAKTQDRALIEIGVSVTPCPSCGCTDEPINQRTVREGEASGTHNGREYGAYRLALANCPKCNRALSVREYKYTGEVGSGQLAAASESGAQLTTAN